MVEQDGLFGGEVAKDGASTDTGRLGDLIDGGFGVAVTDEQVERGLGYAGPGLSGLAITYRGLSHALAAYRSTPPWRRKDGTHQKCTTARGVRPRLTPTIGVTSVTQRSY